MTHYLLAVHWDDARPASTDEQMQKAFQDVDAWNKKMMASGAYVYAGGLTLPDDAVVIDNTGDSAAVRPGSFVAGPRRLGGFWVVDAPDRETALRYAHEASAACNAPVELRAFQDE